MTFDEQQAFEFFKRSGIDDDAAHDAVATLRESTSRILPTRNKVVTTDRLIALNESAIDHSLNRTIEREFYDRLDPDGYHMTVFALYHDTARGEPTDPHVRAVFMVKVRDDDATDEIPRVVVDCDLGAYMDLPEWNDEEQRLVWPEEDRDV